MRIHRVAKANYSAWHINSKDFSDAWPDVKKLGFLTRYAVLAPSGHNTQPWRFKFDGKTMILKADYNRQLPYSGIQANEPFVSLGACLGILELAAKGFGYKLTTQYVLQDDVVATINISGRTPADPSLLDAITRRVSNRNPYQTDPLPSSILKQVIPARLPEVSTQIISDKDGISYIARLTTEATLKTFADKEFRAELSKWVRNNITKQPDGMPGFVQGIPTPVSLFARHIIKRLDVSKDQAKKDSSRVLYSANLVIVTVSNPSDAALMNGGRTYAHICTLAEQQHVASAGVGAAIIDPETTKDLIRKFDVSGKPIAIIRLGKANKPAQHTPRWSAAQLTD